MPRKSAMAVGPINTLTSVETRLKELLDHPPDFQTAVDAIAACLKSAFGVTRVTLMLYNKSTNMLEACAGAGVPNVDFRDIRAPVLRMEGISSRAVEARSFLENKMFLVRNRNPDPIYRMRHKFPHKTYSREFVIYPITAHSRKLGVLSIAVDENNPTHLTPAVTRRIGRMIQTISQIVVSTLPRTPNDRKMVKILKTIFDRDLLDVAFQPIVDIRKNKIHGHEALLRVRHPQFAGPEMLLAHAEKFNFLRDVSHCVHSRALSMLDSIDAPQKIFLNLHAKDFKEYADVDRKSNPFYKKDLTRIVLEITERSYVSDPQGLNSILKYFKGLGIGIAIDDLGSGYSSLEMLTILEPDYIKLDIGIIRNIHQNVRKQKLIRSLLYYGSEIGCRCIAEGVETKEELDVLAAMNCSLIQGFYFARPAKTLSSEKEFKRRLTELRKNRAQSLVKA